MWCRKGRLHHHEISDAQKQERYHWWRWLAFWNYNNKGPKLAISWWIAWTFFYGSALFTLGSAASLSHKVPCVYFYLLWCGTDASTRAMLCMDKESKAVSRCMSARSAQLPEQAAPEAWGAATL